MSENDRNENKQQRSDDDASLEREIRAERKFTLSEAIGRLAGPGSMKGASPIARTQQVVSEIETWLRENLTDSQGALLTVLLQQIRASDLLLKTQDQPLTVLCRYCQRVLDSEFMLTALVRAADIEWGRAFNERPRLDKPGEVPQSDDPYTAESVRTQLRELVEQLSC